MPTVILQARVGSTRLPGKALREIAGKPMLYWCVAALKGAPAVDRLVLATSDRAADDRLAELASAWEIPVVRGPLDDVLARFWLTAQRFPDTFYFRATGDNPLLDRDNPLRTYEAWRADPLDYCCETEMPLGSIVEGFTFAALQRCQEQAVSAAHREHVTLFMKESPAFRCRFFPAPPEYRRPDLRLTVDYEADFFRAKTVIESLHRDGFPPFASILAAAERMDNDGLALLPG